MSQSLTRKTWAVTVGVSAAVLALAGPARAEDSKVAIAISGWTGFAPLTLTKEAGLFKKHGLEVTIKKSPQKRPASGD